jgi:putative DNA primase/helicase
MRGVIDSGHERQMAYVLRVINDKGDVGQFSTWCPKAIAMIGVPKRTILSRSIRIAIERKGKALKLEKLRRKHFAQFEDLRRKISKAASMIKEAVRNNSMSDDDTMLSNRVGDNWEPLLAIAGAASDDWLEKAKSDAESMHDKNAHDAKSFEKYLLESIGKIIAERRALKPGEPGAPADPNKFFLRTIDDLLNKLNRDVEAPWKEKPGDELTARGLGKILTGFGVIADQVRPRKGEDPVRGYWSNELEEKIKQYE